MARGRIALREYRILIAAHRFWVLYIDGKPVSELNGMATDRATNNPKPIGGQDDLLKVWENNLPEYESHLGRHSVVVQGLYMPDQPELTMLEGDYEIVKSKWEQALLAAQVLNDKQIKYNLIGSSNQSNPLLSMFMQTSSASINPEDITEGNSNSVARTLGDVMGFDILNIRISGLLAPGQEKNLLPKTIYPGLYNDEIPESHSNRLNRMLLRLRS